MDQWRQVMDNPIAVAVLWHGVITVIPFVAFGIVGAIGWAIRRRMRVAAAKPSDLEVLLRLVRQQERHACMIKAPGSHGDLIKITNVEAMLRVLPTGEVFLNLTGVTEDGPVGCKSVGSSMDELVNGLTPWSYSNGR